MKNMKIEINEQQSLDDVVRELERLGYSLEHRTDEYVSCIATFTDGFYHMYEGNPIIIFKGGDGFKETTLAELKDM